LKLSLTNIKILILAIVFGLPCFGNAQSYHVKKELVALFEDQSLDIWVKTYEGLEDSRYPIHFIVAQDGKTYKAILHYPDSGDKLYYDAKYTEDKTIEFTEKNESGQPSGSLVTHVFDNHISGTWTDLSFRKTSNILAIEDKVGKLPRLKCENLYKVSTYTYPHDKDKTANLYECGDHTFYYDNMENISAPLGMIYPHTYALVTPNDSIVIKSSNDLTYTNYGSKSSKKVILNKKEILKSTCHTWATYDTRFSVIIPKYESKEFQEWTSVLVQKGNDHLESIKKSEKNLKSELTDRNGTWAGIDTRVSYFDERYISGDVFYFLEDTKLENFVYDRKKDKFLEAEEIVDFNLARQYFTNLGMDHRHIKLTDTGLVFSRDFDIIQGSDEIEILFSDINKEKSKLIKYKPLRNHVL